MPDRVHVLIASPLEADLAARIDAVDPRVTVLYEPELLPRPRYPADHTGVPREMSAGQLARWSRLRRQADVSFDFDWLDPARMPENCPRLRWVQATSAGVGAFMERAGLADSQLVVTTAAGVHGVPLAEFTLLGLLYFAKKMPTLASWKAARHWQRHASGEFAGTRVLVVGLGGVGRQVARLLAAAGAIVTGVGRPGRRYEVPGVSEVVTTDRLDAALPAADALVLACPLTSRTRGLIGAREIALLPRGAVLVNVSRGAVVDEAALEQAVASGHLGGACLDVFTAEPLSATSPLWGLENVIISPHSAATVTGENARITDIFCDNLRRWLDGQPLRNTYDRAEGY